MEPLAPATEEAAQVAAVTGHSEEITEEGLEETVEGGTEEVSHID